MDKLKPVDDIEMAHTFLGAISRILLEQTEEIQQLRTRYHELLYGVASRYPGETRHETALRYIREAENRPSSGPDQAEKKTG